VRDGSLIPRFGSARRDPTLAVLEGFHPVKHALRFGAQIELLVTRDAAELARLAAQLAPELAGQLAGLQLEVPGEIFDKLVPLAPTTGVLALASRPTIDRAAVLREISGTPVVLLEDPRDLGNMGACVRVAAGADAAGVFTTGTHDPWHPDALRGAAGLHFALPVGRLEALDELEGRTRTLLALDPEGEKLDPATLDGNSILAFGTERQGLSDELLGLADARVRIPMRPGVSSLNLATSVAAVLFAWRLSGSGSG
jgi:RNA methyltransferase, TrmH family